MSLLKIFEKLIEKSEKIAPHILANDMNQELSRMYDSVKLINSSIFDVELDETVDPKKILISGSTKEMALLVITQKNSEIIFHHESSVSIEGKKTLKIKINPQGFSEIQCTSIGGVSGKANEVTYIDHQGMSPIDITVDSKQLRVKQEGLGKLKINAPQVKNLNVYSDGQGACEIEFKGENAMITHHGMGQLKLKGSCQTLDLTMKGMGKCHLELDSQKMTILHDCMAALYVSKNVQEIDLKSKGMGVAHINSQGTTLRYEKSGMGNVHYGSDVHVENKSSHKRGWKP